MAHEEIQLNDIPAAHPVAVFADFWIAAAADRPAPEWREFDATQHPKVLPWVLLLQPEPNGSLRYSICGTGCTSVFGFSYEGKEFGDGLPAEAVEIRKKEFARAQAGEAPLFSKSSVPIENREYIDVFRGVFPFLAPDLTLQRMMVVISPVNRGHAIGL